MIDKFKTILSRNITNAVGWRTNRKIVVIESDDWGSIRMPSKQVYNQLLNSGIRVDNCPYNRFDSLASEDDLSALFEVLLKFKDSHGNHSVITANTVVANPDFDKIRASNFMEYYYEPFTETLQRYYPNQHVFKLWQEGVEARLLRPQFHGREHVNVPVWLNLLQQKHEVFLKAFNLDLWGIGPQVLKTGKINIQASFDSIDKSTLVYQKSVIKEGLDLFEKIFGYRSDSFIANNFIWDSSLNDILAENRVTILQGMKYQILPIFNGTKRKLIRHYIGEVNKLNQVHLLRNCGFEPSQNVNKNNVQSCLSDISNAFFWQKAAIISAHRLNFIGNIDENNRNMNLTLLERLLSQILIRWPDVEFMTSDKLGKIIHEDYYKNK